MDCGIRFPGVDVGCRRSWHLSDCRNILFIGGRVVAKKAAVKKAAPKKAAKKAAVKKKK